VINKFEFLFEKCLAFPGGFEQNIKIFLFVLFLLAIIFYVIDMQWFNKYVYNPDWTGRRRRRLRNPDPDPDPDSDPDSDPGPTYFRGKFKNPLRDGYARVMELIKSKRRAFRYKWELNVERISAMQRRLLYYNGAIYNYFYHFFHFRMSRKTYYGYKAPYNPTWFRKILKDWLASYNWFRNFFEWRETNHLAWHLLVCIFDAVAGMQFNKEHYEEESPNSRTNHKRGRKKRYTNGYTREENKKDKEGFDYWMHYAQEKARRRKEAERMRKEAFEKLLKKSKEEERLKELKRREEEERKRKEKEKLMRKEAEHKRKEEEHKRKEAERIRKEEEKLMRKEAERKRKEEERMRKEEEELKEAPMRKKASERFIERFMNMLVCTQMEVFAGMCINFPEEEEEELTEEERMRREEEERKRKEAERKRKE